MVTAETAPLVRYLKADLQRIVNSANEELKNIRCAGLVDSTRQAEESRVVNEARAFAVRRIESTVRHLHTLKTNSPIDHRPVNDVDEPVKTARFKLALTQPDPEPTAEIAIVEVLAPAGQAAPVLRHRQPEEPFEPPTPFNESESNQAELGDPVVDKAAHALPEPEVPGPEAVGPDAVQSERSAPRHAFEPDDSDDTEVFEQLSTLVEEIAPFAQPPTETSPPEPPESDRERLERVLKFVARQEPGVRWAVGIREDGSTLLVTDLAH